MHKENDTGDLKWPVNPTDNSQPDEKPRAGNMDGPAKEKQRFFLFRNKKGKNTGICGPVRNRIEKCNSE
jgi:hypothetical protein